MIATGGYSNERAARGQALNLAVHDAVALNKQEDLTYILKKFVYYFELAAHLQEVSIESLKSELK